MPEEKHGKELPETSFTEIHVTAYRRCHTDACPKTSQKKGKSRQSGLVEKINKNILTFHPSGAKIHLKFAAYSLQVKQKASKRLIYPLV